MVYGRWLDVVKRGGEHGEEGRSSRELMRDGDGEMALAMLMDVEKGTVGREKKEGVLMSVKECEGGSSAEEERRAMW